MVRYHPVRMLELPTNIHQAPPTDAVAVEQNKRNYLFFVDAQYIKYYEGPEGGKEGPSVSYKIKTLKLNGKPIKVKRQGPTDRSRSLCGRQQEGGE